MRIHALCLLLLVNGAMSTAHAQDTEELRRIAHELLRDGHNRIGYSATYDVLADLYEDPADAENVLLFYSGRSQDKDLRVNEDGRDGWNREHLWPQSHGTRSEPMKSDLHHLKPTDASINANRGSLDFDEGGSPEGEAAETFLDGDSFDPKDDVQGDIARALFYMDVRYEGSDGEPDLILVDSSTGSGSALGHLCTILDWHVADPVDTGERARNDRIELIQGNRNLFVDDPDLALHLFGASCGIEIDDDADGPVVVIGEPGEGDEPTAPEPPATSLRLATWNIANFWHVEGEHLRPARDGSGGLQRSAADYDAIRGVIAELDADVIGLQEIGSPQSLETIFPPTEWDHVFSRRFGDDLAANPDRLASDTTRDIYTAVVVRRSAAKIVGTERIELDILHEDGRPVREGTATLVEVGGMRLWAVSLHLKSGCHFDNDLTQRADCRTLAMQLPILEDWLDAKSDAGFQVALLGDFNRRLDRGSDVVREEIDDQDPTDLFKVPHFQELTCSAFSSNPQVSIDYVIVNEALWDSVRVPDVPSVDVVRSEVSDHCPVFVDVSLSD